MVTPGHRLRPARGEHGVAGDVDGLLADLRDAPPDHVVDEGGVEAGALGQRPQHVRRQVDRVDAGQRPLRLPTGVRTASTMTASRMTFSASYRTDVHGGSPPTTVDRLRAGAGHRVRRQLTRRTSQLRARLCTADRQGGGEGGREEGRGEGGRGGGGREERGRRRGGRGRRKGEGKGGRAEGPGRSVEEDTPGTGTTGRVATLGTDAERRTKWSPQGKPKEFE